MPSTSKQPQQTTHTGSRVSSATTVEVTDPAHALYGLRFPLREITSTSHLGRVCVVELVPGVLRRIPVAATQLARPAQPPSPCRLSVPALRTLLSVVASIEARAQERRDGDTTHAAGREHPADVSTSLTLGATRRAASGTIPAAHGAATAGLVEPCSHRPEASVLDRRAGDSGGAP